MQHFPNLFDHETYFIPKCLYIMLSNEGSLAHHSGNTPPESLYKEQSEDNLQEVHAF